MCVCGWVCVCVCARARSVVEHTDARTHVANMLPQPTHACTLRGHVHTLGKQAEPGASTRVRHTILRPACQRLRRERSHPGPDVVLRCGMVVQALHSTFANGSAASTGSRLHAAQASAVASTIRARPCAAILPTWQRTQPATLSGARPRPHVTVGFRARGAWCAWCAWYAARARADLQMDSHRQRVALASY